jgi:hypothetical protein
METTPLEAPDYFAVGVRGAGLECVLNQLW